MADIQLFPGPLVGRYLFMLCSFSLESGAKGRIRGWRQLLTLGVKQTTRDNATTPRVIEQVIRDPEFKLPEGNVSWHLMDTGPPGNQGIPVPKQGPFDLESLAFRMSTGPALLYEDIRLPANDPFYVDLTAYQPPNQGRPWGIPLLPGFGIMYDLRTPWRAGGDPWYSLDIPLVGPRTVAFFASVRQSNPSARVAVIPPTPFFPFGLSPEEQFLLNFPAAIYWRIGASLIVDDDAHGRREIVTTGIDEQLQTIGGDAFGHIDSVGLRIPTLDTETAAALAGPMGPTDFKFD